MEYILPRSARVEIRTNDSGYKTYHLFFGEQEFPYYIARDGMVIEDDPDTDKVKYVVVRIPVVGTVDIPDEYFLTPPSE